MPNLEKGECLGSLFYLETKLSSASQPNNGCRINCISLGLIKLIPKL